MMQSRRPVVPRRTTSVLGAIAVAAAASAAAVAYKTRRSEMLNPPRGRFVTADGVRLHYMEAGSGAPVVLLHGTGAMTDDLRISGLFDTVSRSHRTIVYDRRGFGYSERPRTVAWTPTAQAKVIAATNTLLGLERPVIVGHSWGTLVALALALEHRDHVAGLVLVSGFYYPETRIGDLAFAPAAAPVLGDVLNHTVSPWIGAASANAMIKAMFAPEGVPTRFSHEFPVALTLRPSQIKAFAEEAFGLNAAAASLSQRYGEIRVPTTIIAGDADAIVDVAQSERLHNAIPDSRLVIKSAVSHMAHHSAQDDVVQAIKSIVTRASDRHRERDATERELLS